MDGVAVTDNTEQSHKSFTKDHNVLTTDRSPIIPDRTCTHILHGGFDQIGQCGNFPLLLVIIIMALGNDDDGLEQQPFFYYLDSFLGRQNSTPLS